MHPFKFMIFISIPYFNRKKFNSSHIHNIICMKNKKYIKNAKRKDNKNVSFVLQIQEILVLHMIFHVLL